MNLENNANRIKKSLMIEVAKLAMAGKLEEGIDRLVVDLYPRKAQLNRCCIYKDRAVVKYRLMAILGHRVEDELDEMKLLREYAAEAVERDEPNGPILTVIDTACSACSKVRHFVTNVCRGCVARPCVVNCPKDAISIVDGQAKIDSDNCVNCGKCVKVCPYHAIVYVPVPCEEACPVGAISKDETGTEHIDYDKCIFCGRCMRDCPFGAIMERSQIIDVITALRSDKKVVAMLAPSLAGQFPDDFGKVIGAVKKLGFGDVVEVAYGADITSKHEAEEFVEKIESGQRFMTSSCCPVYKQAAVKHIPELEEFISSTPTPMSFAAKMVKQQNDSAVTVFIGPCIAKRQEAMNDGDVDYVLTAEELGAMLVAGEIEVAQCDAQESTILPSSFGRRFAYSGGVTEAVENAMSDKTKIKPVLIDGLDKKNMKKLEMFAKRQCPGNFVEVMNCEGGCVAGPGNIGNPRLAVQRVDKLAQE